MGNPEKRIRERCVDKAPDLLKMGGDGSRTGFRGKGVRGYEKKSGSARRILASHDWDGVEFPFSAFKMKRKQFQSYEEWLKWEWTCWILPALTPIASIVSG